MTRVRILTDAEARPYRTRRASKYADVLRKIADLKPGKTMMVPLDGNKAQNACNSLRSMLHLRKMYPVDAAGKQASYHISVSNTKKSLLVCIGKPRKRRL